MVPLSIIRMHHAWREHRLEWLNRCRHTRFTCHILFSCFLSQNSFLGFLGYARNNSECLIFIHNVFGHRHMGVAVIHAQRYYLILNSEFWMLNYFAMSPVFSGHKPWYSSAADDTSTAPWNETEIDWWSVGILTKKRRKMRVKWLKRGCFDHQMLKF